jgi:AcrR family transcriptional regulator
LRRQVIERLRLREAELQDALLRRLRTEAPDAVNDTNAEYTAGLRAAVNAGLDYMLTGIELGTAGDGKVPEALLEQAKRAAREGVGIHIVLQRYMIGHRLVGEQIVSELAKADLRNQQVSLNELLGGSASLMGASNSLLKRLTEPVADAYRQEIAHLRKARLHEARLAAAKDAGTGGAAGGRQSPARVQPTPNGTAPTNGTAPSSPGQNGHATSSSPQNGSAPLSAPPSQSHNGHGATGPVPDSLRLPRMSSAYAAGRARRPRRVSAKRQRTRILEAATTLISEHGYADTTTEHIAERAGVPLRTFEVLFLGGIDECMIAIMNGGLEQVAGLAAGALAQSEHWRDGVRGALAAVLAFFDSEPALARVCVSESLTASLPVRMHREQVIAAFRELIYARILAEVPDATLLSAECVMASVMGLLHTRLTSGDPTSLLALLGPLMGRVVTPFVTDTDTAAEELLRSEELTRAIMAGEIDWLAPAPLADRN